MIPFWPIVATVAAHRVVDEALPPRSRRGIGFLGAFGGLSDAELAAQAGIPVSALLAIRAVESNGNPRAVRFEPHLFLRDTSAECRDRPSNDRCTPSEIITKAIYSPSQIPYTPGSTRAASSVASETNRAAFERAYRIDPAAAVRATSWGSFQVLGGKLIALYGSPSAGVAAFDRDPQDVSNRLLVEWMRGNSTAAEAARAGDWYEFVHRYNGCSGSGCDRYVARFTAAMGGGSGGGAGTLLLLGAAGAGAWWYFKRGPGSRVAPRRKPRRFRR